MELVFLWFLKPPSVPGQGLGYGAMEMASNTIHGQDRLGNEQVSIRARGA